MEIDKNKAIEIINNSLGVENFGIEKDSIGIVYHTNKHEIKATINGECLLCYGLEVITNSYGSDVLVLKSPNINGFELDDTMYRLEVDLNMITSLEFEFTL